MMTTGMCRANMQKEEFEFVAMYVVMKLLIQIILV